MKLFILFFGAIALRVGVAHAQEPPPFFCPVESDIVWEPARPTPDDIAGFYIRVPHPMYKVDIESQEISGRSIRIAGRTWLGGFHAEMPFRELGRLAPGSYRFVAQLNAWALGPVPIIQCPALETTLVVSGGPPPPAPIPAPVDSPWAMMLALLSLGGIGGLFAARRQN